jgi:cytochrome c biogenesis protein CcdA
MPVAAASSGQSVIIYFNGGCSSCVGYVEKLEYGLQSIGVTNIVRCDYYTNRTALLVLSNLRERFQVPHEFVGSVTTVVDDRYVFEGFFPIDVIVGFINSNPILDTLVAAQGLKPDTYQLRRDDITLECSLSKKITECLSSSVFVSTPAIWAIVLVSGFVNGLNPCAFAVLAYFTAAVSVHRSKKETLLIGLFYVLAIYLVYLAIGTGLVRVMLSSGSVQTISRALGVFVVAVAILSLWGISQRRSKFPLRIPKRLILPVARRFSHSWIQRSAISAALLFGGVVAALEFPCTGGLYTAILGMLSLRTDLLLILYLLGYNLMFVMPLIILLILFYEIANFPSLVGILRTHRNLSRVMSSVLMLGLGVFLLMS